MVNIILKKMRPFEEPSVLKSTGELLKFSEMTVEEEAIYTNLKSLSGSTQVKDKFISGQDIIINIFDDSIEDSKIVQNLKMVNYDELSLEEKTIFDALVD